MLILFSFQSNAAHRDLHSFPTRRSSDLFKSCRDRAHASRDVLTARRKERRNALADDLRLQLEHELGHFQAAIEDRRSEEHTSELQSHVNLVCRLLLEKKK